MGKNGQVTYRWVENFPNSNDEGNNNNTDSDTLEFILVKIK